jgi:hypothetical protein
LNNSVQNDEGAVLVEVLVAFTILIVVIMTSFQIFGEGMNRSHNAADRAARVAEAASQFTFLPDQLKLGTTTVASSFAGRDFTIRVTALRSSAADTTTRRPVLVQIYDGSDQSQPPLYATVVLSAKGP